MQKPGAHHWAPAKTNFRKNLVPTRENEGQRGGLLDQALGYVKRKFSWFHMVKLKSVGKKEANFKQSIVLIIIDQETDGYGLLI